MCFSNKMNGCRYLTLSLVGYSVVTVFSQFHEMYLFCLVHIFPPLFDSTIGTDIYTTGGFASETAVCDTQAAVPVISLVNIQRKCECEVCDSAGGCTP